MVQSNWFKETENIQICESFVFEFLPDTLTSVMRREKLDITDIKLYTWQLFNGLRYLSMVRKSVPLLLRFLSWLHILQNQIVHRDIKPLNVLIDHPTGLLKIGDFGSAKMVGKLTKSTSYQVTRFYRPPELLLGSEYYNWTVDLWSAGCVVGEMVRGNVLFPGRHGKHQLKLIFLCFGSPTEADIEEMRGRAWDRIRSCELSPPEEFTLQLSTRTPFQLCPYADAQLLDLIAKILVYRPKNRLHGSKLLKHPVFNSIFVFVKHDMPKNPGAKRSSGQPISAVITSEDRKDAQREDANNKAVEIALTPAMKKKLDFTCDEVHIKAAKTRVKSDKRSYSSESKKVEELEVQNTMPSDSDSYCIPVKLICTYCLGSLHGATPLISLALLFKAFSTLYSTPRGLSNSLG
ncbi:unnamed protein product [Nippostrongylus brasiliensis]|uniref:Putative glycogen synthase kinase 3-related (inferred by orthology to a S. mansoni protein) n=1 Tax=Nippostrongylus brasiliensis TaxID=27835 RepID=A0A0N4YTD4_NIPBR|nr:unnamed protein product [Nippostrongylus brasiliensis]